MSITRAEAATSLDSVTLRNSQGQSVAPAEQVTHLSVFERALAMEEAKEKAYRNADHGVWWRALNYRCGFCLNKLSSSPRSLRHYVLMLFSLGEGYCPHCFTVKIHPIGIFKLLVSPIRALYYSYLDAERP